MLTDDEIAELLSSARTLAIVGASSNPERESFDQMSYFRDQGYRVIPVNPSESVVLGERAYASLEEIPEPIDVVLAFRRAEATPPLVRSAAAVRARALWLPEGVSNAQTRGLAEESGLGYVEARCPRSTHRLMTSRGMISRGGSSDAASVVRNLASRYRGLFDWVGVYWVSGEVLELGPYAGAHPDGHERITIPEGVCGAVAASGLTEIVPDVSARAGHIACELSTRSEVVAPIVRQGRVVGVLDVDSDTLDAFGTREVRAIEEAAAGIATSSG
jgi:hypothetical protein